MRRTILGAIFFVPFFLSCQSEVCLVPQSSQDDISYKTFHATAESPISETKVYADANMKVVWNADDRIAIFDKYTYGFEWRFNGEDGASAGTFTQVPNEDFVTGNILDYVYAVYPYAEDIPISNSGVLTLTLPATQSYKAGSFGPSVNTMVSVTENNNLAFKNLGGFLMLKLYGSGITVKTITLAGNKNEKIAGKASVEMPVGGTPSVTMAPTATETVTLNCGSVALGSTAGDYVGFWLVLPPTDFSEGFTITVTDALNGTFVKKATRHIDLLRNQLIHMEPLEVTPTY